LELAMRRPVIVESEFIVDLFDGDRNADETAYRCLSKGYSLSFTATSGHEIVDLAEHGDVTAKNILLQIKQSPVQFISLDPIDNVESKIRVNAGLAHYCAKQLIEEGAVTSGCENMALILAETGIVNSVLQIHSLMLGSQSFAEVDIDRLKAVLIAKDLPPYRILKRMNYLKDGII
jgi:hypothetical protein